VEWQPKTIANNIQYSGMDVTAARQTKIMANENLK